MFSRESASHYLITLCENGDLQRLCWALQRTSETNLHPAYTSFAEVALATESVLVDAQVGTIIKELNLHRMLCAAARSGHEDAVERLLEFGQRNGVAVGKMVTMDTMDASFSIKPLEVLLKFKAVDPNVFSHPLHLNADILFIACHGGPDEEDGPHGQWLPFVQYLLDVVGRDPNSPNADPGSRRFRPGRLLYNACWFATVEIVECLLEHGALIQESRAMRNASCNGRIDVLEALLRYGGDVNETAEQKTGDGPPGTPLHVAAAAGREDVVRWLLARGADDMLENSEGKTARDIWEEKSKDVELGEWTQMRPLSSIE